MKLKKFFWGCLTVASKFLVDRNKFEEGRLYGLRQAEMAIQLEINSVLRTQTKRKK